MAGTEPLEDGREGSAAVAGAVVGQHALDADADRNELGANPVHLVVGPDGHLWYVDFNGTVRRIVYTPGNQSPLAALTAGPMEGPTPLTVTFDASGSTDPDGGTLSFRWDLDGNGVFDAPTPEATATYEYTDAGLHEAAVEVSDGGGGVDVATVTIRAGGTSPSPTIIRPGASRLWAVGDVLSFRGSATDLDDGTLPASSCHEHPIESWTGTRRGSFVAPDHAYPSHLELRLSVIDSDGYSATVSRLLHPQTVRLRFQTGPRRLSVIVGSGSARRTPFSRTFIVNSTVTLTAPARQTRDGVTYRFRRWSDGGARTHEITAPSVRTTYTARYRAS